MTLSCIIAAALATLTGCGDAPSAPNMATRAPSLDRGSGKNPPALTSVQSLLRSTPLAAPVVVVKTLSNKGGKIAVPGTDFELVVPAGAFEGASMTFTITAYAGNIVAYDFQPHGVTFLKPLQGVQQLSHTTWKGGKITSDSYTNWAGAYFANSNQLNESTGEALINELMPCTIGGSTIMWGIPHFSGYMISTGRSDDGGDGGE